MLKILIVDDSEYMRHLLDDILKDEGFEVHQASNGQEMLDIFDSVKPDVVLIDIVMPVLNGIDAIKILHEKNPDARIIVCSAQSLQSVKDEAYAAGACGYIQKPFGVDIVMNAILDALKPH